MVPKGKRRYLQQERSRTRPLANEKGAPQLGRRHRRHPGAENPAKKRGRGAFLSPGSAHGSVGRLLLGGGGDGDRGISMSTNAPLVSSPPQPSVRPFKK
ncbi:hypothetical protein NL676_007909 [Syzygium grande]|nr:hypothetical protein NL676_007909 [Syzygium grande]